MLSDEQVHSARAFAAAQFSEAGIVLTEDEVEQIEVSDFGLSDLATTGIQLITYVNTARVCAKDIVLAAGQTCPEHRHISVDGEPGKEETFRVRRGVVYLYVEGPASPNPMAAVPRSGSYTAGHQIVLAAGDQYTVMPDTLHWFQAGPHGAIVSEFSTRSTDEHDVFTDPAIVRLTVVERVAAHPIEERESAGPPRS